MKWARFYKDIKVSSGGCSAEGKSKFYFRQRQKLCKLKRSACYIVICKLAALCLYLHLWMYVILTLLSHKISNGKRGKP